MNDLIVSTAASCFSSTARHALGFIGVVSFQLRGVSAPVVHHCIRYRDLRSEALEDARRDARELIRMAGEMVRLPE